MRRLVTLIASTCLVLILVTSILLSACAKAPSTTTTPSPTTPAPTTPKPTTPAPTTPKPTTPAPTPAQPAQVYKWSGQSTTGPGDIIYIIVDKWQQDIEKWSNGRFDFTLYPPGAIVKSADVLDALREGVIETANSYGGYWMGFMPEGGIEAGLPMILSNAEEATQVWYGEGAIDIAREAYAEKGVYLHSVCPGNEHSFWATKPITKVDDLKGLKIRAVGETANMFKELGAAVVYIPHEESFMGLQLGTVSAYATSLAVYDTFKHYEVAKYVMAPAVVPACTDDNLISLKHLNALPADLKSLLTQHEGTFAWYYWWMFREYFSNVKMRVLTKPGIQVVQMTPELQSEMTRIGVQILQSYGAKSARAGKLADVFIKFMKTKGYIK